MMFRVRQSYNPAQTICFTEAMKGPIASQSTVMVIGAAHLSALRGLRGRDMDAKAVQHKVRALRMLNQGVRTITAKTAMDILFGILSLANVEVRFYIISYHYS